MDPCSTTTRGILVAFAAEDPNVFLSHVSDAGLSNDDIDQIDYLITLARRAPGYDARLDTLRRHPVC